MLFPTFSFMFVFFPLAFLSFYILKSTRYSQYIAAVLLTYSLVFYLLPNWSHGAIFVVSILVNYFNSKKIQSASRKLSKTLLVLGIGFNLCVIGYYKYLFFFSGIIESISGFDLAVNKLILPVGISFYTFQQIAYLCDCHRDRNIKYKLHEYALFVSFFPQLIAGPIVHHQEMMPQISELKNKPINWLAVQIGFGMFIVGLAKKLIVADNLAHIADPVFKIAGGDINITMDTAWIGTIAYTLQLYFDFSAYSDMAIGLGLIFGLKLPVNFFSPYKATSIVDFWRRWHMTLSRFLRDYLYIPLGGNRDGKFSRYRNLMLTMLLGGLWHGAGWNFIFWGGLHGAYLMINHGFSALSKTKGFTINVFVSRVLTLFAVMIAWVFFRAEDLSTALNVLHGMLMPWLSVSEFNESYAINNVQSMLMIGAALIALYCPNTVEIFNYKNLDMQRELRNEISKNRYLYASVAMGLLLGLSLLFVPQPTVFIYFNF